MATHMVLRRLLIPTSGCGLGMSVVYAKKNDEAPPNCDESRTLVRACELPLYSDDQISNVKCTPKEEKPSLLIDTIRCARQELWVFMDQARIATDQVSRCYDGIKGDAQNAIDYLREESNVVPRIGAIAIGGLTGLVLGLRKGLISRLLYTTSGAAAMAALCYPKEAREYGQEGINMAKKYILISYHFLNGVSRDLTGYQLPALPSHHLVISDGHHHESDAIPSSAQLLPPTANATHIPMPHEDRSEEIKRMLRDQSHPDDKDLYSRRP